MKNLNTVVRVFSLVVVFVVGCGRADERFEENTQTPSDSTTTESAMDLLRSLDPSRFRDAFNLLSQYSYTRSTGIIQLSSGGQILASRNRTIRFLLRDDQREFNVLSEDSMGAFNFGLLGSFADRQLSMERPADLSESILPEDPPYLSPRNRDDYIFRLLPDTLLQSRATRVIEVIAKPDTREDQPIYLARHFIDRESNYLVGIHLERRNRSALFREWTIQFATIAVTSDNNWLPHEIQTATRLKIPFLPGRQFETDSQYFDYVKPGDSR